MSEMDIVRMAKQQLSELTGLEPDTVSGLRHEDDGWHVTVEMIDLERIPNSTDVLDSYDVVLDDDGKLLHYERIKRYYRGEAIPAGAERRAA